MLITEQLLHSLICGQWDHLNTPYFPQTNCSFKMYVIQQILAWCKPTLFNIIITLYILCATV